MFRTTNSFFRLKTQLGKKPVVFMLCARHGLSFYIIKEILNAYNHRYVTDMAEQVRTGGFSTGVLKNFIECTWPWRGGFCGRLLFLSPVIFTYWQLGCLSQLAGHGWIAYGLMEWMSLTLLEQILVTVLFVNKPLASAFLIALFNGYLHGILERSMCKCILGCQSVRESVFNRGGHLTTRLSGVNITSQVLSLTHWHPARPTSHLWTLLPYS